MAYSDTLITQPTVEKLPRLDTKDPRATRRTIARLIRKRAKGEIDEQLYKAILHGLQHYLAWFCFERDLDIEDRIERLEKAVNA